MARETQAERDLRRINKIREDFEREQRIKEIVESEKAKAEEMETMLYLIYDQLDLLRRDVKSYKHPIQKEGIVPVQKPQTNGSVTSGFFVELDVVTAQLYSTYIQRAVQLAIETDTSPQIISMDGFSNLIQKVKWNESKPESITVGLYDKVFGANSTKDSN